MTQTANANTKANDLGKETSASATGTNAPQVSQETKVNTSKETHYTDGMMFPKVVSHVVYLRRIPTHNRLPGQELDEGKQKIGSSFKGNSVLRGLTFDEEAKYLPSIIGVDTNSPNWENTTRNYWANLSKDVPPKDGIELEVGLRYTTKEDYIYDQENAEKNHNGIIINHKGIPVNMADYILWRYCLDYSKVANTFEDIGKSPKIEFYLFSKSKEILDKKNVLNNKKKALQLMYKSMSERNWVDYVLRVLVAQDKTKTRTVDSISKMGEDEKDILLDEYVVGNPDRFLLIAEDKNLEMRSFIELSIAKGNLQRVANTDTITMDGLTLGNTINEVIAFLTNAKNSGTLSTLKAQLNHLP